MVQQRIVYFLFFVSLVSSLSGQTASGTLRGLVQDSTGARVVGASIEVRMLASASIRRASSDERGEFLVQNLPPGGCNIIVSASGFATASAEIVTAVSTVRDFTVSLMPAAEKQAVQVMSQRSSITSQPIELAGNVHQSIISRHDLEAFPLSARSFANIAYLAPGTEPLEPSDPTKARITAVSTGGSSGLNNELSIDGGDNSDDFIGGFLENYSPDAIQEFAVRTAQENADTGSTTAGSIVITTMSGTNVWHGDAAFYERSAALNARFPIENPAPNPKQPFSRQNYIDTLGGPVREDHLWFFGAIENVHENASIVYSPASTVQFNALATLAANGFIPNLTSIAVPAQVPIPFRDTLGMLRLDWAQSPKSSWMLRSSIDTYTTHNNLVAQGALPSTGLLTHNNYLSLLIGNQHEFSGNTVGNFVFNASGLHLTQTRSSNLGFGLAFPFSSTSLTVSGFETFGDNQFATPITFFPSQRNQEKYQSRYDISMAKNHHSLQFGFNLIHEPVLSGAFPGNAETLYQFPENPTYYIDNRPQFTADLESGASTSDLGGAFSQNVQRVAVYGQDSWRVNRHLTCNYGLRYSATWGLFLASGHTQRKNPGYLTITALRIPLVSGAPHDDRKQMAPRLGFAYTPGKNGTTVIRVGFGLYFDDLAQTGWATAFQGVNSLPAPCVDPVQNPGGVENAGCVAGGALGGRANLIDPRYKTPYAIHASGGVEHAFSPNWAVSADYIHEQGNHAYRGYSFTGGTNLFTPVLSIDDPQQAIYVPDVNVFHSDNRSSYDGLLAHLQGNISPRLSLVANYTLARAQTWGCVLGELFDYVNGVCDPLHPFGPGDYGPSGEDVRHRIVVAATVHGPGAVELSALVQAESARPYTITTADGGGRIAINGKPTTLDQFRGTPYIQVDMRLSRPIAIRDHWSLIPFIEFFSLFNRNNPGANYVTNIALLPVPGAEAQAGNVADICKNVGCTATVPIYSPNQLRMAGGALGDFFGPGTTVGIPFAAQVGARLTF
jgi:hypothetical protein